MTKIGSFKIDGSFKIASRGFVIFGEIMSGTVSKNNFLAFCKDSQNIKLKIKGVDFLDNIKKGTAKIGLTFYEDKQIENLQTVEITPQIAIITEL